MRTVKRLNDTYAHSILEQKRALFGNDNLNMLPTHAVNWRPGEAVYILSNISIGMENDRILVL